MTDSLIFKLFVAFFFAVILLVPGGVFANNSTLNSNDPEQYYNDNYTYRDGNKLEPDFEDLPNEMEENIRTNLSTLDDTHSDVTNLMIEQNKTVLEDYDGPDIPIIMTYIDDGGYVDKTSVIFSQYYDFTNSQSRRM